MASGPLAVCLRCHFPPLPLTLLRKLGSWLGVKAVVNLATAVGEFGMQETDHPTPVSGIWGFGGRVGGSDCSCFGFK